MPRLQCIIQTPAEFHAEQRLTPLIDRRASRRDADLTMLRNQNDNQIKINK